MRSRMIPRATPLIVALITVVPPIYAQGIDKPPKFVTPLTRDTRTIALQQNVTVLCEVDAKPAATYRWTLNNVPISGSSNYLFNSNNGTLHIQGFRGENAGNYQCFAENVVNGNRAVAMSSVITIREAVLNSNWQSTTIPLTKQEGDYLQFRCENPPECVPAPLFSWNQVSESSSSNVNKGEVKPSNRIYIDNEGTLHFTYLTMADDSGSLTYKCGLRNSVLELIKLGSNRKLTVTSNGLVSVGATNRFFTNPAKFIRTRSAELECVFSGYPIPTITWKDRERNTITGNTEKYTLSDNRNKLTIKNLDENDEGNYVCEGSNAMNTEEVEIFLNVTSGPIWEKSLSSQTRPEGTDAVFSCKARPALNENLLGIPIWFINGEKIDVNDIATDGKMEFSDSFRVLTVKNLNKQTDIKCFQCNVSNEIGYEMGDGCLNVIEPIFVTTKPDLRQVAVPGKTINLTVLGTTDPLLTLKYRWRFKNASYEGEQTPPYVFYDASTNQSYIDTSSLNGDQLASLLGTYHRILYHSYETKTVSIEVISEAAAAAGVTSALGAEIGWIIAICIALILVIIAIILLICYIRYKSEEGAYKVGNKEKESGLDPEGELKDNRLKEVANVPIDSPRKPTLAAMDNPSFRYDDDMHDISMNEYGSDVVDFSKFNEDGSFIGQYKPPQTPNSRGGQTNRGFANESVI